MASSELRHRPIQPQSQPQQQQQPNPTSPKPQKALKSLALSILIPLTLTSISIYFFTTNPNKPNSPSSYPFLFPPLFLIQFAQLISSALMGFASWFVWVDGGFSNGGEALLLYVSHVALCVTWEPLVLGTGAVAIGFVFCVINFGTVVAVYGEFRKVNRVAGQIVKPCVAWMALLTFLTFRLVNAVE